MNEKQSFIIEDLDDFHVVIKADEELRVRRELEAEVRCTVSSSPLLLSSCRELALTVWLIRILFTWQLEKNTFSLEQ